MNNGKKKEQQTKSKYKVTKKWGIRYTVVHSRIFSLDLSHFLALRSLFDYIGLSLYPACFFLFHTINARICVCVFNIHEAKWLCFACALFVSRFSVNLWSKVTKYHKPITKQQMQWQLSAPPTNHMTSCTHTYFTAIIFYRYYRCYTFIFYAHIFFAVDFFGVPLWPFMFTLCATLFQISDSYILYFSITMRKFRCFNHTGRFFLSAQSFLFLDVC